MLSILERPLKLDHYILHQALLRLTYQEIELNTSFTAPNYSYDIDYILYFKSRYLVYK